MNAFRGESRARTLSEKRERKRLSESLKNMFLNYPVLNQIIESTMRKYGLRNSGNEFACVDPEILLMLNKAAEIRYTKIIRDLIEISRSQHALQFINKKVLPRDTVDVNFLNSKIEYKEFPVPHHNTNPFPFAT
jgi:hypothetical protein